MNEKTAQRLRPYIIILSAMTLVFVTVFAGIIIGDLVRPLPHPVWVASDSSEITPTLTAGISAHAPRRTTSLTTASASNPQIARQHLLARHFLAIADRITSDTRNPAACMPIPEAPFNTYPRLPIARRLNAEAFSLYQAFGEFYRSDIYLAPNLAEARARDLSALFDAFEKEFKTFFDYWMMDQAGNFIPDDELQVRISRSEFQKIWSRYSKVFNVYYSCEYDMRVYNGQWLKAAECARHRCSTRSWDEEVAMLRLAGAKGTRIIAQRSAERNWTALRRTFTNAWHNHKFHWPHNEPGD